jgi:hypothetical protein
MREMFEIASSARDARLDDALRALDSSPEDFRDTVPSIVATTDGLFNLHTVCSMFDDAHRHAEALRPETLATLTEIKRVVELDLPGHLLPEDVADELEKAADSGLDPNLSSDNVLAGAVLGPEPEVERDLLSNMTRARLWSLHATVLAAIATVDPGDQSTPLACKELRAQAEQEVRAMRDGLHDAAVSLGRRAAGPAWAMQVWALLDRGESWLTEHSGALAAAAAAASPQDGRDSVARDASLAYEAVRNLLAEQAAGWAVLRAWATVDAATLRRFSRAATLKLGSGTADLPRASLRQAAHMPTGSEVEVASRVADAEITAGGPAPRSILTLGRPRGTQLTVLVPFIAVDSFGVVPGVWVQVRGEVFADGKDGIPGPIVLVSRIQREEAAKRSFFDFLLFEGRREFELRPGGLDLVAGRLAAQEGTLAELGLRRGFGG